MADLPLEKEENVVKSYFKDIILGYLSQDINTLLNPEFDEKEQGGCAAPLAITIFSAMNQLGYLTSTKNTKEIIEEVRTEDCIKEFCNDWMRKIDEEYKKSTVQEIMVNFFRHGIAHQFMSIALSAITRDPKQDTLLKIIKNESGEILFILQVKILAKNFLGALNLVNDKIDSSGENDPEFIIRFCKRLDRQKQIYMEKNVGLLKKADKNLEAIEIQEDRSSTTVSGTKTKTINSETSLTIDRSSEP